MSECTHNCSTCGESCGERTSPQSFLKKPHADGSPYNLRQLATVAGIAEQGFFIPQGEKKGLLVAEDCWAILMPCRTTGRETDSVWDHFIKELTKSPTNTCPSRKEEK